MGLAANGVHKEAPHGAPSAYPALFGLQVLVVEDEVLVSMMLEDMLEGFGCVVVGAAPSVPTALARIRAVDAIDVAILDVNLGGEKIFPVADILTAQGVPVVFSTGFGPADLAERYPESRLLAKPYGPEPLAQMLFEVALQSRH